MSQNVSQCQYFSKCKACNFFEKNITEQQTFKKTELQNLLSSLQQNLQIKLFDIGSWAQRTRMDLAFLPKHLSSTDQFVMGYPSTNLDSLVDIENCEQLAPDLKNIFPQLRQYFKDFPYRVSLRFRISRDRKLGIWLDMANIDVKNLLENNEILEKLNAIAVIEIGQKRKRLVKENNKWRLKDPKAETWFTTYITQELKPMDIYCHIGSFTQPSYLSNKSFVGELLKIIEQSDARSVLELCCGIGNFTFPIASLGKNITALDLEESYLENLKLSLDSISKEAFSWKDNIKLQAMNIYRAKYEETAILMKAHDLLVVDPPRSGLREFLDLNWKAEDLPPEMVYISCFFDSLSTDLKKLIQLGYKVESASVFDQFPQTKHSEYIIHLKK